MSAFLLAIPRQAALVSLDRAAALMTVAGGLRPVRAEVPAHTQAAAAETASARGTSAAERTTPVLTAGVASVWYSERGDVVVCAGVPERAHRPEQGVPWSEPLSASALGALWQSRGAAALDELVGAYAVAVWNAEREELLLQVDQLNMESLFLRVTDDALLVSTEVLPLLAVGGPTRFEERALRDIVRYRFLAGTRSCWQGIRQIRTGRRCVVGKQGTLREEAAPRVYFGEPDQRWSRKNGTERLELALRGNLERLRDGGLTDVAVFVSGGIDSAVLAALAKRTFPRCTAVTFQVDDYPNPELARAQEVARRVQLPMHLTRVQPGDVARLYPWIIGRMQEPPLHYNNPIIVRMLEDVRDIAPVVLSGDVAGMFGMSLHGGMRRQVARQARLAGIPTPVRHAVAAGLRATGVARLRRAAQLLDHSMQQLISGLRTQQLHPEAAATLPADARVAAPTDDFLAHVYDASLTDEDAGVMWSEQVVEGAIFRRNSRFSGALGVRYHFPLFDVAAMDLITATPPELRFDSPTGLNKPLLRDLCDRYLGADVTGWSKLGLPSPEREWLEGPLAPYLRDSFADASLLAEFVDVRALRALPLARHQSTFWTLMTLHEVLRQGNEIMAT